MLDGWLQLIRGPRPQSTKWPTKGQVTSKAPSKSRPGSQVADAQSVGQRGPPPQKVVMNARARVAKLEAAMAALGEADPIYFALQEALKKAKAQSQVRPVEERIASSKVFIERVKKRIGVCQEELARAQQVLSKAQAKLQSEEQVLAEGEARLADLISESEGSREEGVPPTMPASFARELAELRACVQELREENSNLRSKLQSGVGGGEERERKQARNLSNSTLDLVPLQRICADHPGHGACQSQPILHGGRADATSRMETMIDNADARFRSNRFNPLSG